jgi:hypothetical protein
MRASNHDAIENISVIDELENYPFPEYQTYLYLSRKRYVDDDALFVDIRFAIRMLSKCPTG